MYTDEAFPVTFVTVRSNDQLNVWIRFGDLPDICHDTSGRRIQCKEPAIQWTWTFSCKRILGSRTLGFRSTILWIGWSTCRRRGTCKQKTKWSSSQRSKTYCLSLFRNHREATTLLDKTVVYEGLNKWLFNDISKK